MQPGLARQIVDLKTASSNLVGPVNEATTYGVITFVICAVSCMAEFIPRQLKNCFFGSKQFLSVLARYSINPRIHFGDFLFYNK